MTDTTFRPAGVYGPNKGETGCARGEIEFLTRPLGGRGRASDEPAGEVVSG
jgi:hypothetical protein